MTIKNSRFELIDCIRGGAIVAMMAYHFAFDLNMQGYILQDLNHNFSWQLARSLILGTFLFIAGFSMALAAHQTLKKRVARLLIIAACAVLVSVTSYFMFADSWIFFGVLHFMVVASLICWLLMPYKKLILVLSVLLTIVGIFYQSTMFNQTFLQWVGMMTHKPITEDYVPILPWIGVMMFGIIVGQWALTRINSWPLTCTPHASLSALQWLGRHSLAVYMLHQPLLLGALSIFGVLYR